MSPQDTDPLHAAITARLASLVTDLAVPPAWYEAWQSLGPDATEAQRLAVYQAIRDDGVLPDDASFYLVSWQIDALSSLIAEAALGEMDDELSANGRQSEQAYASASVIGASGSGTNSATTARTSNESAALSFVLAVAGLMRTGLARQEVETNEVCRPQNNSLFRTSCLCSCDQAIDVSVRLDLNEFEGRPTLNRGAGGEIIDNTRKFDAERSGLPLAVYHGQTTPNRESTRKQ